MDNEYRECWLIFGGAKPNWTQFFLKPGFDHIQCITKDMSGYILINAARDGMVIYNVNKNSIEEILKPLQKKYKVLYIKSKYISGRQFMGFRFFTCVTLMKYIIGAKLFCVTPFGLYRKLLKCKNTNTLPEGVMTVNQVI